MTTAAKAQSLLHDPIPQTLWQMTWPVIIGVLTLISFNVVDTFFIGMLGTEALAAVSFTFPVTFTLVSLSIGLGIGTSAVIARKRGSGQPEQARFDGFAAITIAALLSSALAILAYVLLEPIFLALGAEQQLLPAIRAYMTPWLLGAALLVVPMVGNAVLRAVGNTRIPSLIMASGGLLNAVFDPLLIFGLGPFPELGIQGAAIATVISWLVGSVLVLWYLQRQQLISTEAPEGARWSRSARAILKIGLPAASANMLTPLAMAVLTAIVASYGAHAVAAFGVGTRLESLASVVVLALSMSLPPLISQNFGAGYYQRMRQAYVTAVRAIFLVQLLVYVLLVVLAPWIAMAFTEDPEVARLIRLFIYIMPLGYGLQGLIILTNSSFNAMHQPLSALSLSIIRLFVMFVPLSYLGAFWFDLAGMFVAGVVANGMTAALAWWWFHRSLARQQESL